MTFSLVDYKSSQSGLTDTSGNRFGIGATAMGRAVYGAARRAWRAAARNRLADEHDDKDPLFVVPGALESKHVAGCTVYANRYDMIRSLQPGLIWAEVGTWEGAFAREILTNCRPSELQLFDIDFSRVRQKGHISETDVVRFNTGPSSQLLATFPDEHFDVIYIDADHSLLGVSRDADVAVKKVKRDGVLIFNDYIFFSHLDLLPYGVVPVVNSLCVDLDWRMDGFALHRKMYCDVMLRRR